MRILGLDFGSRTIGVAVSDPFGWSAQGLEIIRREDENNLKKSIARIKELCDEYSPEIIVLGYPKNMNNKESERNTIDNKILIRYKIRRKTFSIFTR